MGQQLLDSNNHRPTEARRAALSRAGHVHPWSPGWLSTGLSTGIAENYTHDTACVEAVSYLLLTMTKAAAEGSNSVPQIQQ